MMIEIRDDIALYYSRFDSFPVFETYLRYAIRDVSPRIFVDRLPDPRCVVLSSLPAFFILGEPENEFSQDVMTLFHHDSWIIAKSPAWGNWILNHFQAGVVVHDRIRFASDALDLEHLRSQRHPLPDPLRIVPIDSSHIGEGMIYEDVISRFFTKSDFLTEGFGFALVDHRGVVQGFALTNYPIIGKEVELYVRVGYESIPKYRAQGFGTTLCSAFIEEALSRGYHPVWDSANPTSAHIALKLGYTKAMEWQMFHIL